MELDASNSVGCISCFRPRKKSCCWGSRWRSIPRSCCAALRLQHCKNRRQLFGWKGNKQRRSHASAVRSFNTCNTHLFSFEASFPISVPSEAPWLGSLCLCSCYSWVQLNWSDEIHARQQLFYFGKLKKRSLGSCLVFT